MVIRGSLQVYLSMRSTCNPEGEGPAPTVDSSLSIDEVNLQQNNNVALRQFNSSLSIDEVNLQPSGSGPLAGIDSSLSVDEVNLPRTQN